MNKIGAVCVIIVLGILGLFFLASNSEYVLESESGENTIFSENNVFSLSPSLRSEDGDIYYTINTFLFTDDKKENKPEPTVVIDKIKVTLSSEGKEIPLDVENLQSSKGILFKQSSNEIIHHSAAARYFYVNCDHSAYNLNLKLTYVLEGKSYTIDKEYRYRKVLHTTDKKLIRLF
ncbi:hypothetical protein [Chryseobacterium sp. c4a]|uniref:hypothetical protein n=1 Tax=Chryseobacterium sp. c4a TaxID=1573582 RepID=UPI00135B84DC|nr:hypothetical protein [Chryseobacterium sp. c4a]